jgi:toxin FitB
MTGYLLDTNIISNATKPTPSAALGAWLKRQADHNLFVSSMGIAELWRGVLALPLGRKRRQLEDWFEGPNGPPALFAGRVLGFDGRAAIAWAELMSRGTAAGRPRSPLDMIIAATARVNDCVVVTDNERDFAGLDFINPMRL